MIVQRKENHIRAEDGSIVIQAFRKDPYGFWSIEGKNEKKKIDFDSEYTSASDALKAIEQKILDIKKTPPVAKTS